MYQFRAVTERMRVMHERVRERALGIVHERHDDGIVADPVAATSDVRIKAVATSAMYDMNDSMRNHYEGDYYTPAQRETVKK